MHLFYYGTWLMGLLSLFSVLAIYGSNRRVIRDLKNVPAVKDKWLQQFLLEYQRNVKDDSAIHTDNPSADERGILVYFCPLFFSRGSRGAVDQKDRP